MSGMLKGAMGMPTGADTQQQVQQQQQQNLGAMGANTGLNEPRIGSMIGGAGDAPELGMPQLQQPTLMQNSFQMQDETQRQMAQLMKLMNPQ